MRKRLLSSFFISTLILLSSHTHAQGVTRIVFAKGSYCGSYTGDFSNGKRFTLGLGGGQRFTSRNTGGGEQYDAYLVGPTGKVNGQKVSSDQIDYITPVKGMYEVFVHSSEKFGSVEFCAY